MAITQQLRKTYYAPACGRSYLTKRGACMAQANRAIRDAYGEPFEHDTGAGYDPLVDDDMLRIRDRYFRMLMRSVKS